MSIFRNFFKHGKFPELRISKKMASLKSWNSRQKQGIDLQPFQIFKTMRNVLYFRLGKGNSFENFQSKFIVPRYLKYSCLKSQGYSYFFCKQFLKVSICVEKLTSLKIHELQGKLITNAYVPRDQQRSLETFD